VIPGDRLLYVNDVQLTNATLDMAVMALRNAPLGPVVLGIAKPLPIDDHVSFELFYALYCLMIRYVMAVIARIPECCSSS
jgi:hypothetical protein